ncbi:MAG TPA: hypothetical protein VFA59_16830 [Vicinamibacterales bacterium]|nr:hypothetical protein [Vicinamibacterales bacterium]
MAHRPPKRRRGRPAAGFDGAQVRNYPRLSIRVPPATMRHIARIAKKRAWPQWRVVVEAMARFRG